MGPPNALWPLAAHPPGPSPAALQFAVLGLCGRWDSADPLISSFPTPRIRPQSFLQPGLIAATPLNVRWISPTLQTPLPWIYRKIPIPFANAKTFERAFVDVAMRDCTVLARMFPHRGLRAFKRKHSYTPPLTTPPPPPTLWYLGHHVFGARPLLIFELRVFLRRLLLNGWATCTFAPWFFLRTLFWFPSSMADLLFLVPVSSFVRSLANPSGQPSGESPY